MRQFTIPLDALGRTKVPIFDLEITHSVIKFSSLYCSHRMNFYAWKKSVGNMSINNLLLHYIKLNIIKPFHNSNEFIVLVQLCNIRHHSSNQ